MPPEKVCLGGDLDCSYVHPSVLNPSLTDKELKQAYAWEQDMEGHAEKCVDRYCELAGVDKGKLKRVATPCMDDHQFSEAELSEPGRLAPICARAVLKCLYLARIARPDLYWSVNYLARAVTKWTKACDRRMERLISYIHFTTDHKIYNYVGDPPENCFLALFQDASFAGDLTDSKSTSGGLL